MRRARMLAVSVVLVAACAGDPVRLGSSLPEDRTVDFTRGRPVYAQATGMQVLWFVPISINDRHARAWDSLQRRAPNHYITDVRIEEIWTWGFIGTFYTTQLQATAYPYVDEPWRELLDPARRGGGRPRQRLTGSPAATQPR